MANMCEFEMTITVNNVFDKNILFKHLDDIVCNANREQKGCYIGSEDRYLFEAVVQDVDDYTIWINGWVKWGVSNNEMVSFFKFLNDICFIQELELKIFESGNGVCEKYIYEHQEENVIKRYYLSMEDVMKIVKNNCNENGFDFCNSEEQCFEKLAIDGVCELVKIE